MKVLGVCLIAMFAFSFVSCSDDDDPVDNDLFVGTYNGSVGFIDTDDDTNISSEDGRVTVVKIGDKYNFDFNNSIPSITGIEFEKENENTWINIGGSENAYIRIDQDDLRILYNNGSRTWTANAQR